MSDEWRDRRVLVVGLGVSGFAAARALVELGARVRVTEGSTSTSVESRAEELRVLGAVVETGGHDLGAFSEDTAIVSPGISPDTPIMRKLSAAGVRLIGEVEFAYRLARCDFVAVTGTNGKTTTTSLLGEMLRRGEVESMVGGNIGNPLVDAVRSLGRRGAVAVEVSSFQLATIETFRPRVAVLLNVAEDHTDWHGTFAAYAAAKARIFENQTPEDVAVVNADDPVAAGLARDIQARVIPFSGRRVPEGGAGLREGALVVGDQIVASVDDISLTGSAGAEDSVAAAAAAFAFGVDAESIASALREFAPLPHRLQTVREVDGVTYIDDSKATNPHATMSAVRGLSDVVLIAGGRSKGIDLAPLVDLVPPVLAVVALGEARAELTRIFDGVVPVFAVDSMGDAVRVAHERANGKGSVLLSPGCASLDMYESYVARGQDFTAEVHKLTSQEEDKADRLDDLPDKRRSSRRSAGQEGN